MSFKDLSEFNDAQLIKIAKLAVNYIKENENWEFVKMTTSFEKLTELVEAQKPYKQAANKLYSALVRGEFDE